MVFPEACPFTAVDKGLYFFHICRHRKSHLVVRTYHLSASIAEKIHLCWLQLLSVPTLVGDRPWIPPLHPPSWSLWKPHFICHSFLLCYAAYSLHLPPGNSVNLNRSHTYRWWSCHCHQLQLQGRAMKSNCCWIVTLQLSSPPTDVSFQPFSSFCFFIPSSILRCTTCRTLLYYKCSIKLRAKR